MTKGRVLCFFCAQNVILVDNLFEQELTEELVNMLEITTEVISELRAFVVDKLLEMLRTVLRGYRHDATSNTQTLKLALMTLANFNFYTGHVTQYSSFLTFARDVIVRFLSNPDTAIRQAACLACAPLLIPPNAVGLVLDDTILTPSWEMKLTTAFGKPLDPTCARFILSWEDISSQQRGAIMMAEHMTTTVTAEEGDIVKQTTQLLLQRGISDISHEIRLSVLVSLDEPFLSPFLADTPLLRLLINLLHDSLLEVRLLAMQIVGRLGPLNPGMANPELMVIASQLLSTIKTSGEFHINNDLQLLAQFVRSCPSVAQLYVKSILEVVMPHLRHKQVNAMVVSQALSIVGALASVDSTAVASFLPEVMPLLIQVLRDQSSILRRRNALRTLADIAQGVGYVIKPYTDYPELMPILANVCIYR